MAQQRRRVPVPLTRQRDPLTHDFMGALRAHLLVRRLALGLSQSDVARRTQVTKSAVSRWELGQSQPDLGSLVRWVSALDTEVTFHLGEYAHITIGVNDGTQPV